MGITYFLICLSFVTIGLPFPEERTVLNNRSDKDMIQRLKEEKENEERFQDIVDELTWDLKGLSSLLKPIAMEYGPDENEALFRGLLSDFGGPLVNTLKIFGKNAAEGLLNIVGIGNSTSTNTGSAIEKKAKDYFDNLGLPGPISSLLARTLAILPDKLTKAGIESMAQLLKPLEKYGLLETVAEAFGNAVAGE